MFTPIQRVMCNTQKAEHPVEGPIEILISSGNGTDTVTAKSTSSFSYVVSTLNTYMYK